MNPAALLKETTYWTREPKFRRKFIAQKTWAQDNCARKLNNPTYHFAGQFEKVWVGPFFWPRFLLATAGMKFTKLFYPRSSLQAELVVYLCIIFESMHTIFALPGWRHKCILKKRGLVSKELGFLIRQSGKTVRHSFLFVTFSPAPLVSIPPPKYQSEMTNLLFSQYAFVTSPR